MKIYRNLISVNVVDLLCGAGRHRTCLRTAGCAITNAVERGGSPTLCPMVATAIASYLHMITNMFLRLI